MELLLKVFGVFLYINLVEVHPYIYDTNPYGYVAAVNNMNAFPKNRISGYKKYFRSNSFTSEKLVNEHAVDSQLKVPSSNTFAALPTKHNYFSSPLTTEAPERQNNALEETVRDESMRKELIQDQMRNKTKSSSLKGVSKIKKNYSPANQNSPAVHQRSNIPENQSNRKNNHISKIKKNIYSTQNHDGAQNTQNTQMLEIKNKVFNKVNSDERNPQKWLSRIDNLQKYIDTFARQAEYRKRDTIKHKTYGVKHQQHQKKIYDGENYEPSNWISMKNARNEKILNFPARIGGYDVGDEVNKTPYALFYKMNRDSYEQPALLGQDVEASINVDDVLTYAKLDKRDAANNKNVGKIIMNYNTFRDR